MSENEKNDIDDEGLPWHGIVLVIVLAIVFVYVVSTMNFAIVDEAISKTKAKLNEFSNKSEDYRQGWLDALRYVKYFANEGTNMTANVSRLCD